MSLENASNDFLEMFKHSAETDPRWIILNIFQSIAFQKVFNSGYLPNFTETLLKFPHKGTLLLEDNDAWRGMNSAENTFGKPPTSCQSSLIISWKFLMHNLPAN